MKTEIPSKIRSIENVSHIGSSPPGIFFLMSYGLSYLDLIGIINATVSDDVRCLALGAVCEAKCVSEEYPYKFPLLKKKQKADLESPES